MGIYATIWSLWAVCMLFMCLMCYVGRMIDQPIRPRICVLGFVLFTMAAVIQTILLLIGKTT